MLKVQPHGKHIFIMMLLYGIFLFFLYSWRANPIHAQTYYDNNNRFNTIYSRLNQEISNLFLTPKSRFLLSSTRVYLRCATPLVKIARQYPELLEESNRFILYRPTDSNDYNYYYGSGVDVWSYDSHLKNSEEEGHFRLYYTEDNSNGDAVQGADGQQNTIPAFVTQFADYFEEAWFYLIENLGYDAPIEDNEKVEVFILKILCYGITSADNDGTYIMVSNDYQWVRDNLDSEGKEIGAMKVTAVHEFFHVVQAGYDNWPDDYSNKDLWWEENTAVWIEDELYDEVNDYLNYLGWPYEDNNDNGRWDDGQYHPAEVYFDIWGNEKSDITRSNGWFDYPHVSLNKTSYDCPYSYFEYGGVIWVKYLGEKYGQEIVRTIFENQKTGESALSSIQTILTLEGLKSDLKEFKEKILIREFEEGESYPLVWHAGSFDQYPVQFNSYSFYDIEHEVYTGNLDHLAAHYLRFLAPEENETMGNITFSFIGSDGTAELSCLLMLRTQSGLWERRDIPLNSSTYSGEIIISGFGHKAEYQSIVAIPINLSSSEDNASFTIEASFLLKPHYVILFRQGMNLFSPAIPEGQVLDSHQFLLHHFTPDSLYSLNAYQTGQWVKNSYKESFDSYKISGPPFNLAQGEMYILYLESPCSIILESSTNTATPSLNKGVNFLSYSPQMLDGAISNAFTLLQDLDNKASAIRGKHEKSGKWKTSYHFFRKRAGENFPVTPGKTYMAEMIEERI